MIQRVRQVTSFDELINTRFAEGVNALCWSRALPGDFAEVAQRLGGDEGINSLEEEQLTNLAVSAAGRAAIEVMLTDLRQLRDAGLSPELNLIRGYLRDESDAPVRTDVCSFHVDRAPIETDTWLCTYVGAPSEGLINEEAERRVDLPETRAALLRMFGDADDASFREFLSEHCFDLHYAPRLGAQPYSFGLGKLWRIATQWPGSPVPPCIHRAPETTPGDPPRLLLIS